MGRVGVWLLLTGCPSKPADDSATPPPSTREISVDLGVGLFGEDHTGSALAAADLDGDGADELVFFEQRYSDAQGTGAAVGVWTGRPASAGDLTLGAVFRAYGTDASSIFGFPSVPLADGRLLAADWAVQCDGDGAVWVLDGPFTATTWNTTCASRAGWARVAAPDGVVGFGNAVVALPGGYAVGAPASAQVFVYGETPETRTGAASYGTSLLAADLDGDGIDELGVGAPDVGEVDVGVHLHGDGGFGAALTAGDLDGDGRDDLLVGAWTGEGRAGIWWLFPSPPVDGGGSALTDSAWIYPTGPSGEVVGDLDGDGHAEFMAASPGEADGVTIWYGPFPSERAVWITGPGGAPDSGLGRAQTHGDLDGDGEVELLLAAPLDGGIGRPGIFVLPIGQATEAPKSQPIP